MERTHSLVMFLFACRLCSGAHLLFREIYLQVWKIKIVRINAEQKKIVVTNRKNVKALIRLQPAR